MARVEGFETNQTGQIPSGVVGFVGSATGVVGSSVRGDGVRGFGDLYGVAGTTFADRGQYAGVFGQSANTAGVKGVSTRGIGVFAESLETSLRDRIERVFGAWLQAGHVDRVELSGLLADAARLSEAASAPRESSLEERWRDVQAMLERVLKTA